MRKRLFVALFVLVSCLMLGGCGKIGNLFNTVGYVPLESAGYYSDVLMTPNGEFWARGKVDDEEAAESGLVFKVELSRNRKCSFL